MKWLWLFVVPLIAYILVVGVSLYVQILNVQEATKEQRATYMAASVSIVSLAILGMVIVCQLTSSIL